MRLALSAIADQAVRDGLSSRIFGFDRLESIMSRKPFSQRWRARSSAFNCRKATRTVARVNAVARHGDLRGPRPAATHSMTRRLMSTNCGSP